MLIIHTYTCYICVYVYIYIYKIVEHQTIEMISIYWNMENLDFNNVFPMH